MFRVRDVVVEAVNSTLNPQAPSCPADATPVSARPQDRKDKSSPTLSDILTDTPERDDEEGPKKPKEAEKTGGGTG